jgi:hypothetical protein
MSKTKEEKGGEKKKKKIPYTLPELPRYPDGAMPRHRDSVKILLGLATLPGLHWDTTETLLGPVETLDIARILHKFKI